MVDNRRAGAQRSGMGPSTPVRPRVRFGGLPVVLLLTLSGCGRVVSTAPVEQPAPEPVIEAMNRVWVLNTWDSDRWDERYREAVLTWGRRHGRVRGLGQQTIEELSENPPPGGLTALLGVPPRIRLEVSRTSLTLFREDLDSIHVRLDGTPTPLDGDAQAETLTGRWVDEAVRLEWDFGSSGSVVELWELPETRHRLIVNRTVSAGGDLPVSFEFRQVYDRYREPLGPGGDPPADGPPGG